MRIITNTNIIVDDFGYCKSFPPYTFIHFLTHFHADHWDGLTPLWQYGFIYCTEITKLFILNKFPKIKNVVGCQYNKKYQIQIGNNKEIGLIINFYFFDAKHIPGSSMILFEGYIGRILFTGDFRYNIQMVLENPILFPNYLRKSQQQTIISKKERRRNQNQYGWIECQEGISIQIDEMIFDNTYCNQMFKFGKQKDILQKLIEIIQKQSGKKILIAMSALGKQKLLYQLSRHFQTLICISDQRYKQIQISNGPIHIFTTNQQESFIHIIKKKHRKIIVEQHSKLNLNFICIDTDFLMVQHQSPDKINYILPYSLHSNYNQLCTFIKLIKPAILRKLVIPYQKLSAVRFNQKIDNPLKLAQYLNKLQNINKSKSGYSYLVKKYADITKLSRKYLEWMKPENQKNLILALGLIDPNHSLRKRDIGDFLDKQYKSNKQSLNEIANKLNATHKNYRIMDMVRDKEYMSKQHEIEYLYKNLFQFP